MGIVVVACMATRGPSVHAFGQDDINLERNEFGRKSGEPLALPFGISVLTMLRPSP